MTRKEGGTLNPMTTISSAKQRQQTLSDYFQLTKPRIVALLVFTTLAAMLIASDGPVPTGQLAATVLGGTLAAAGASALNQYFDRHLDARMARTMHRPLPSGRVNATNALLFGSGLLVWSVVVLGFFVNWLSAGLALFGAFYYVVLYTLLLKRNTAVNIILGGGAGAVPVLVGWAAATGSLSTGAWLLFAFVFFWTPPHTWALTLWINADYERVNVPMMSVHGRGELTRVQIVWYSLLLVILTLLPLPLQMLGGLYFGVAVLLGGGLLFLALTLLRNATMLSARRLYRYSSMYLALLFLAMMADKVII